MSDPLKQSFQPISQDELLRSLGPMLVSAGISPADFIPELNRSLSKSADRRRALNNFLRFVTSAASPSLLHEFASQEVLLALALDLFAQSEYLTDILVRNPELFQWLTTSDVLNKAKSTELLRTEALASAEPFERTEKKLSALKRFHRREMLRIGARDILRKADIETVTLELSSLADSIIQAVLGIAELELQKNTGIELRDMLCVVGLGKLGGNELNFSSDIDLMFVYERDMELEVSGTRIRTVFEYCSKLAEIVVRKLSEHSDEGHLYRVDMRLRPDGQAGPLAMSRQGYRNYYETRGELWERQMLLKARMVAGNKKVGEGWLADLEPFVYPKTLLASPLEKIREIKNRIESKTETDLNIKLGTGGIRDIEFITQALQLLNSPLNNKVRQQSTLAALESLAGANALSQEEQRDLREAYLFLRSVEHRLQLLHGQQTHSLPETQDEKQSLAKSLGFESSSKFDAVLRQRRKRVRDIFVSVFEPREPGRIRPAGSRREAGFFEKTKLIDRSEAAKNLNGIKKGFPALNEGSLQTVFWKSLWKYRAEDCALKNFALLCSQTPSKASLTQAVQNERLFDLIILLCSRSSRLIQTLSGEPLLFETLLADPAQLLDEKPGWSFLLESDPLRFRLFNEFKILLRFVLGHADLELTTKDLSDLADIVVKKAFALHISSRKACLVALGKFGGSEISFGSDLDVICVYDDARRVREMDLALKNFFDYFHPGATQIYDIDFQLRPEGKNSPLATELSYYDTYLANRASLWEKQSLLKARVVCGHDDVVKKVQSLIERHVSIPLQKGWTKEILRMRRRMESERVKRGKGIDLKLSKGGLADIEFLVQVLQLKDDSRGIGLSTFSSLGRLAEKKILTRSDARKLLSNYGFLRTMELLVRLNSQSGGAEYPGDKKNRKLLASGLGEKSEKTLLARMKSVLLENRRMFLKALSLAAT
ncbi:MAG: hypothetical protein AABZ41_06815 [Bacteroidota bacterium]